MPACPDKRGQTFSDGGYCMRSAALGLALTTLLWTIPALAQPHLEKQGTATQLVVGGKPMLLIGGELGNSSASSAAYMVDHWPRLKARNLNPALARGAWKMIEPVEGKFDWSSIDQLIRDARAHDM